MNTIVCPKCGEPVEISQALKIQIEREILSGEQEKHKKELEAARKEALEESAKKIEKQFALELQRAKEDTLEQEKQSKELREQITELMKELRDARRQKDEAELEMQKKFLKEEERIRLEEHKRAEAEQHGKLMELEKQRTDALKEVEDMKRKLTQGSQQMQGEVFELEFENMLRESFPNDKILPVGKGIRGGDIIQEVWDSNGNYNGKILWELKNTKAWSESFVDKLRADKRTINAEEAIIISEVLPANVKIAGYHNSIWVTQRAFVITLASTIRAKLIGVRLAKQSVQAKDGKMELMYNYLSGTEFKHRVEAIVEAFTNMQSEIEKEKRYFSSKWARDEKNIRMVIDNTYGMHGDLKSIIGRMLPQIKGLETVDFDTKDPQLQLVDGNESNGKTDI